MNPILILLITLAVSCVAAAGDAGWELGSPIVTYWAGPMPMTDPKVPGTPYVTGQVPSIDFVQG